jgi:sterol 14-demethylase
MQLFLEQKKIFKTGLNISRFRNHIPMIVDETEEYFQRWGDSGKRGMWMRVHNRRNNQL